MKKTSIDFRRQNSNHSSGHADDLHSYPHLQPNSPYQSNNQKALICDLRSQLCNLKTEFKKLRSNNIQANHNPHLPNKIPIGIKPHQPMGPDDYKRLKFTNKNRSDNQRQSSRPQFLRQTSNNQDGKHVGHPKQFIGQSAMLGSEDYQIKIPQQKYIKNVDQIKFKNKEIPRHSASEHEQGRQYFKSQEKQTKLLAQIKQLKKDYDGSQTQLNQLKIKYQKAQETNQEKDRIIKDLSSSLKDLQHNRGNCGQLEKQLLDSQLTIKSLQQKIQKLQQQRKQQSERIVKIEDAKELAIKQKENLTAQKQIKQAKIQSLETHMAQVQRIISDKSNKLDNFEQKCKRLEGQVLELTNQKKNQQKKNQQGKTLVNQHSVVQPHEKQKQQLINKMKMIENEANSHKKHNIELTQILADKQNMIRKMLRDLKNCEKQLHDVRKLKNSFDQMIKHTSQQLLVSNIRNLNHRYQHQGHF